MFTLAISCLTTSNLPWFLGLSFQVPVQYCSLQHWSLVPLPVTPTAGCCFCFDSVFSFFLKLFLHWSPVAYWVSTNLGSSSFSVLSCCLFILFTGSQARILKWFAIPFSSRPHSVRTLYHEPPIFGGPTGHGLWFHWVRQDCGPCDRLVSFLWLLFSVCLPSDGEG